MMKFGLIGVGGIGDVRRKALDISTNCCLAAAFDVNKDFLRRLPANISTFDSAEQMLRSDSCEAVIISTPTQFHQELAIMAMENDKHVIVEKPMASTLEGCRQMHETSRKTGKVLTIGFNHRYFDAIKEVREAITSGAIGKLHYVKGFAGHTGLSEFKAEWMYDKDIMGGGTLMDNGIHTLDLVCHLMGERITSVSGMISTDIWQLDRWEDNAFVHLRGESGILGSLRSSWTEWKGYHFYVEAYGDKGMARAFYAPLMSTIITMDKPGGRAKKKRNFYIEAIFREKFMGWQSTAARTFVDELSDFVNLANGGEPGFIATVEDGVRSIEIPNAIYRSQEEGCFIDL